MSDTVRHYDPRIKKENFTRPELLGTDNLTADLKLNGRRIRRQLGYLFEDCRSRGRGGIARMKKWARRMERRALNQGMEE